MVSRTALTAAAAVLVAAVAVMQTGVFSIAGSTQDMVVGDCPITDSGDVDRCSPQTNTDAEIDSLDARWGPAQNTHMFTVTVRDVDAVGTSHDPIVPWLFKNGFQTNPDAAFNADLRTSDVNTSRRVLDRVAAATTCTLHSARFVAQDDATQITYREAGSIVVGEGPIGEPVTVSTDDVFVNAGRNGVTCVFNGTVILNRATGNDFLDWFRGMEPRLEGSASVDFEAADPGDDGDAQVPEPTAGVVERVSRFVRNFFNAAAGVVGL